MKLVHKEGHAPVTHQVVLPDLEPGEETQLTVNYTPIGVDVPENKLITRYVPAVCSIREFHNDRELPVYRISGVILDGLWLLF